MSLQIIFGDALDFPRNTNVLVHGVSLYGNGGRPVMGAGIAKEIANRWPIAFEVYAGAFDSGELRMGTFTVAQIENGAKRIVNLVSQKHIGRDQRQVDYEAVYGGLASLNDLLVSARNEGRIYSVCMPWIGCGLAGGSREIVGAMARVIFAQSPIEAYIVEMEKSR